MTSFDEMLEEDYENHVAKLREASSFKSDLLNAIPTTWLDPLLTGPDAVLPAGENSYTPKDIENLLNALRKRLEGKLGI